MRLFLNLVMWTVVVLIVLILVQSLGGGIGPVELVVLVVGYVAGVLVLALRAFGRRAASRSAVPPRS